MRPETGTQPVKGGSGRRIRTFGRGSKVLCLTSWPSRSAPQHYLADGWALEGAGVTSEASVALGPVMRNGVLAALVLVTAACGAYHLPGGSTPGTGTVAGHVLALPCAPIQPAGKQCAARPVPGLEIDYTKGDATSKAVTDDGGNYSVRLAAGTWTVHFKTNMRIVSGPTEVSVSTDSTVTADYILDSGIRYPVPQQ
jgi:hypothetical protein